MIYVIDVIPLSKKNLENAIDQISKANSNTDLLIYIGDLKTTPKNLIKIPSFLLKQQRMISGKILDNSQINEKIFDISNWNINLSNFDIK